MVTVPLALMELEPDILSVLTMLWLRASSTHCSLAVLPSALVKDNGEEKYFEKPPDEKGAEICWCSTSPQPSNEFPQGRFIRMNHLYMVTAEEHDGCRLGRGRKKQWAWKQLLATSHDDLQQSWFIMNGGHELGHENKNIGGWSWDSVKSEIQSEIGSISMVLGIKISVSGQLISIGQLSAAHKQTFFIQNLPWALRTTFTSHFI